MPPAFKRPTFHTILVGVSSCLLLLLNSSVPVSKNKTEKPQRTLASSSGRIEEEVIFTYKPLGTFGNSTFKRRCEDWVRLDGPQFKVGEKDFMFRGVNFRIGLAANEVINTDKRKFEVFLAPDSNNEPDNQSFCRDPLHFDPDRVCCKNTVQCVEKLQVDHISKLSQAGINSVRLLMDNIRLAVDQNGLALLNTNGNPYFYMELNYVYSGKDPPLNKGLRLDNPTERTIAFAAIRDGIRLLGANGIRSLLLLNGRTRFAKYPTEQAVYTALLTQLANFLKNEVDLIGYDLYNEPVYNDKNLNILKTDAKKLVHEWVDAIHAIDSKHLITIGNAMPADTVGVWDPTILPIDFQSPHLYAITSDNKIFKHARNHLKQQLYAMALTSCGQPCPFLGKFDGKNCVVGEAPVGTQGSIWKDGMYYINRESDCPVGWKEGANCKIANFDPGRETGFILNQPLFYVRPATGKRCPANTQFDGGNCLVSAGPPGAVASIDNRATQPRIYYDYLSKSLGGNERCRAPAVDDDGKCRFPTPSGYAPFFLYRPVFYVSAQTCTRGKRPIILGETGFAVTGFKDTGEVWTYRDQNGILRPTGYGNNSDQAQFLRDIFNYSHACMGQGILWWQYGDVHWGESNDLFGLFTNAFNVGESRRPIYRDFLKARPAATVMRDEVDYLKPRSQCPRPDPFFRIPTEPIFEPSTLDKTLSYTGTVIDAVTKAPLPNALVGAWAVQKNGEPYGPYTSVYTNQDGKFEILSQRSLSNLHISHFGYASTGMIGSNEWHNSLPGNGTAKWRFELKGGPISLTELDPSQFPPYAPPVPGGRQCSDLPTKP